MMVFGDTVPLNDIILLAYQTYGWSARIGEFLCHMLSTFCHPSAALEESKSCKYNFKFATDMFEC